jgi:hypothetical protein
MVFGLACRIAAHLGHADAAARGEVVANTVNPGVKLVSLPEKY